jgi:hypothetical protein
LHVRPERGLEKDFKIPQKPIYKDKTTAIKAPEAKDYVSGSCLILSRQSGLLIFTVPHAGPKPALPAATCRKGGDFYQRRMESP